MIAAPSAVGTSTSERKDDLQGEMSDRETRAAERDGPAVEQRSSPEPGDGAAVAAEWDGKVESWQEVAASPAFQALAERVVELAQPAPGEHVVDLGAGTGLLALALAPRVADVVAVDASEPMLSRLAANARRAELGNVRVVAADMRSLPLDDESAELVVSNYAFHHLDDAGKELALAEARRVLVPGGRLVVCDMMFGLTLAARDRALIVDKLRTFARRGPAGFVRIARNAVRVASGRWEKPAPKNVWERMLADRHFVDIRVDVLEHEGGVATARRPLRPDVTSRTGPAAARTNG